MGAFSPLKGEHFSSTRNHALSAECRKIPALSSHAELNGGLGVIKQLRIKIEMALKG